MRPTNSVKALKAKRDVNNTRKTLCCVSVVSRKQVTGILFVLSVTRRPSHFSRASRLSVSVERRCSQTV